MNRRSSLLSCLVLLPILAAGCGELIPKIPKPNHQRGTRPTPTPVGGVDRDDEPEEFRSLVDRSALDEPEPEAAPVPTAEETLAAARAKAAREDEERRKANAAARERLARKREAHRAPAMELLEAGTAPLAPLRFALEKGHAETVTMTLGMGMDLQVGGSKMPTVTLPDTRIRMRIYITDVSPRTGDMSYEAVIREAEVLESAPEGGRRGRRGGKSEGDDVRRAMQKVAGQLEGASGTGVVTALGVNKSMRFRLPKGSSPEMKDYLDQIDRTTSQFSAPFPKEPIGVGARWRVRSTVSSRGMRMTQIATYQLLRRDERGASMLVSVEQLAERQSIAFPGMPRGATVTLQELHGKGNGRIVIGPDRLGPVTSSLDLSTKFQLQAKHKGDVETIKMRMTLDLDVETGDVADASSRPRIAAGGEKPGGQSGGPRVIRTR